MSDSLKIAGIVLATIVVSVVFSVWLVGGNQSASTVSDNTQVGATATGFQHGIRVGTGNQVTISDTGNIIQTTGAAILNDVISGSAGYSATYSTASAGSNTLIGSNNFLVTAAQWCSGTQVLIPASNTTTVTMTLPAASTTFATCGATVGSWSTQIVDNESSFPLTLATTSGGNGIVFFSASSTTYTLYPPKVFASTTQTQMGSYISSSALNMYRTDYFRSPGIGF